MPLFTDGQIQCLCVCSVEMRPLFWTPQALKKWLITEKEAEKSGAWRSQYCKIFIISSQKLLGAWNLTVVSHIFDRFKFSSQGKIRCRSYQNKYLPKCRSQPCRFVSLKQIFYFHLTFVPLHFTTSINCGIQDSKCSFAHLSLYKSDSQESNRLPKRTGESRIRSWSFPCSTNG